MSKLILSLDGSVIREVPLDKERVTIGRKPQNDIQIENLAVSGEHARVVTILKDSFLEDLGSTNGTLVNGTPVKKHILQNNDIIEIGRYRLKFVMEALPEQAQEQASMEDFERTMILRAPAAEKAAARAFGAPDRDSGAAPVAAAVAVAAPVAAAAAVAAPTAPSPARGGTVADTVVKQQVAAIQILNGPSAGREMVFSKNLTTLGKAGVQVAVIARRPQGYVLT